MKKVVILSVFIILAIRSFSWADNYFFVTFRYPPFEYEDENGNARGIFVQMVSKTMKNLGHEVRIEVLPWTRALKMVRQGQADAIFTAYKNDERETFLDYPEQVLFPQVVYFYKKKGSESTFTGDFGLLTNKRIGVVSTISYGNKFDAFKSNLTIEKVNKLEHNFEKLMLGRIDLVPSHPIVADYVIQKMGLAGKIIKIPVQLDSVPSYIAFSKKKNLALLIWQFDQEIVKMKESGEYSKILETFGVEIHP